MVTGDEIVRAHGNAAPRSFGKYADEAAGPSRWRLRMAEERHAWRSSQEAKQFWRLVWFLYLPLGVVLSALVVAYVALTPDREAELWVSTALAAAFVFVFYGAAFTFVFKRRAFRDRQMIERARGRLSAADDQVASLGDNTDFGTLWNATQKRLDYYHGIATTQARRSFVYGQIAAGIGLALIVLCAVLAIVAESAAATVSAAVLGVAGGGLAGYIGATFMRAQEAATAQLRAYFAQPLEFSRYLAAERLLAELPADTKTTATAAVIDRIMAPAPTAPTAQVTGPAVTG